MSSSRPSHNPQGPAPAAAGQQSPVQRATALYQSGRADQAESLLRRAVQASGKSPDPGVLGMLASILAVQGKHDQAIHYTERALAAGHDTPALRTNLGNMLLMAGRFEEGRSQFELAIARDPNFAPAWIGLSPVLHRLGDAERSLAAARRAAELAPADSAATLNLASSLVGVGEIAEALATSRAGIDSDPHNIKLITNYLMSLHYAWPKPSARAWAEEVFAEHKRLGPRFAHIAAGWQILSTSSPAAKDSDRPLRVGFLSSDLRNHVVAVFARPFLEHRDRASFKALVYNVGAHDRVSDELSGLVDSWQECQSVPDESLARRIVNDKIDVLVDLNGHTEGSRVVLMARRLAPVQVTYIGYPDTTGVASMDWRIVDAVTDPLPDGSRGERELATERLYRLPGCFLCYTPPKDAPVAVSPLPALAGNGVTFASFNAAPKIGPELLRLWGRLLARCPGSRLLLKNRALAAESRRARAMAALSAGYVSERAGGVATGPAALDPARVELIGWSTGFAEHLATYERVDIALDAMPYNGTTTTCEALWMGVPVITAAGASHVSRVGASLLSAVGLHECVGSAGDGEATPDEAYLDRAVTMASDLDRLAEVRAGLRERVLASCLCDAPAHARALEAAFREMWRGAITRQ